MRALRIGIIMGLIANGKSDILNAREKHREEALQSLYGQYQLKSF